MKEALTTGDVGRYMRIAPRTVAKMMDSGIMKGAYKLNTGPLKARQSHDRRISVKDFLVFLKENNMPVPDELAPKSNVVLCYGFTLSSVKEINKFSEKLDAVDAIVGAKCMKTIMNKECQILVIFPNMIDDLEVELLANETSQRGITCIIYGTTKTPLPAEYVDTFDKIEHIIKRVESGLQ